MSAPGEVRPYRWDLVPRVSRRQRSVLQALNPVWPRIPPPTEPPKELTPLAAQVAMVSVLDAVGLRERLSDPTAFALRLRRSDGAEAYAVVPGRYGVSCAERIVRSGRAKASPPRVATRAEQGVCAFVAAALLERYRFAEVDVELWHEPPPTLPSRLVGWAIAVDVVLDVAGMRGSALVIASESVATRASAGQSALARLLELRGHWLDGDRCVVPVVSGVGRVPMRDLLALARRDVLLLDRAPETERGRLAVGRGGFPVAVREDSVEITGAYERGTIMEDSVAEDVTVEIACQLGTVRTSARRVLELAPGQVLSLDRPLGGPVDIVVGTRVIGRGELVDVDGELGVRVLSLAASAS